MPKIDANFLLAVAAVITSLATLFKVFRTGARTEQIHTLVNSKMTAALQEIIDLKAKLLELARKDKNAS